MAATARLQEAVEMGLVDSVIEYNPNISVSRRKNEKKKRNIGFRLIKKMKCSHFMGMDADEFYRTHELEHAKKVISNGNFNLSTVKSFFHLKRPIYRALDTTNVALIAEIGWLTKVGFPYYPAENVDSTRKIFNFPIRHKFFTPNEIAMYHMNFVRGDFESKLKNTSTTDQTFLSKVQKEIENWRYGEDFVFPKKGTFSIDKVENEFNTYDPEFET